MHYAGDTFNRHAETYYRDILCSRHMTEGFKMLINEFTRMDLWASFREPAFKDIIRTILPDLDLDIFLTRVKMPLPCSAFWYLPGLRPCWDFSATTCP